MKFMIALAVALVLLLVAAEALAQETNVDPRFCGEPARDADGTISRSTQVRAAFIRLHPCPATGEVSGACVGWAADHTLPLFCGGCDSVGNLAWMPLIIKSGPGPYPKDRWERKVYCSPQVLVPMPEKPQRLMVAP